VAAAVVQTYAVPFPAGQLPAFPPMPWEAWTRVLATAPPS